MLGGLQSRPRDAALAMALLMARRADESRGYVRRHPDGRWYVELDRYRRIWSFPLQDRSVPLTRELAEEILKDVRKALKTRDLDAIVADYHPRHAAPNLIPARLERWLEVKRQEAASGDRARSYLKELERWAKPGGHFSWWKEKAICDVTEGALEDWALWLAKRPNGARGRPGNLSAATRARVVGGFHAFLSWLFKRRELPEMPRSYPWPRVPEHEPRVLVPQDQDAVLAAIPEADRGIFIALAHLGLRPSEARALQVSDYRDRTLVIDKKCDGPNQDARVIAGTKTGRSKTLPVSDELALWIDAHVSHAARLQARRLFIVSTTGGAWSHWTLTDRWRVACAKAGVTGVSLYPGTKHSMATSALARGVSERAIQAFLGHADPRSTRRYARLSNAALVQVLRPKK